MKKEVNWTFISQSVISLCAIAYLVLIGGRGDKLASSAQVFFGNLFLFSAVLLFLICLTLSGRSRYSAFPLSRMIAGAMGIGLLAVLFSQNTWISLTEYYYWGTYLAVFIALVLLRGLGWSREGLLRVFLIVGGLFIAGKIFTSLRWAWIWMANNPSEIPPLIRIRLASPNLTGALANVLIMLLGIKFISTKFSRKSIPSLLLLVCSGIVLVLTSSRGALAGFLGGAGLILLVYLGANRRRATSILKKHALVAAVVIMSVAGVGLLLLRAVLDPVRDSLASRVAIWELAWSLFQQHPWFGIGPHTFGSFIPAITSIPPNPLHTHAHNIYLNVLTETGLAGFAAVGLLLTALLRTYIRSYSGSGDWVFLAVLGVFGTFLGHGLVDTLYVEPYYSYSLAILAGATFPDSGSVKEPAGRIELSGTAISLLGFLLLGWFLAYQRYPLQQAVALSSTGNPLSKEYFELAQQRAPGSGLALSQAGIAAAKAAADGKEESLPSAINALEGAVQADLLWSVHYANLGALKTQVGDPQGALEDLSLAVELAPKAGLIALNQGVIAERQGNENLAERAFLAYLEIRGIYPDGSFWALTPLRREIRAAVGTGDYWLVEGDLDLEDAVDQSGIQPFNIVIRLRLADLYLQQQEYALAERELTNVQLMLGNTWGLLGMEHDWLLAVLTAGMGDLERGTALAEKAFDGWRYQSANGPGTYGSSEYAGKIYRSPAQGDDLVPQLEREPMPASWVERMILLGEWYLETGDYNQAGAIFEEVLQHDPGNGQAQNCLETLKDTN